MVTQGDRGGALPVPVALVGSLVCCLQAPVCPSPRARAMLVWGRCVRSCPEPAGEAGSRAHEASPPARPGPPQTPGPGGPLPGRRLLSVPRRGGRRPAGQRPGLMFHFLLV